MPDAVTRPRPSRAPGRPKRYPSGHHLAIAIRRLERAERELSDHHTPRRLATLNRLTEAFQHRPDWQSLLPEEPPTQSDTLSARVLRAATRLVQRTIPESTRVRVMRALAELAGRSPDPRPQQERLQTIISRLRELEPDLEPPPIISRGTHGNRPRQLFASQDVASRQYRRAAYRLRLELRQIERARGLQADERRRVLEEAIRQVTSLPDGNPFVRPGQPPPDRFRQKQPARPRTHRL